MVQVSKEMKKVVVKLEEIWTERLRIDPSAPSSQQRVAEWLQKMYNTDLLKAELNKKIMQVVPKPAVLLDKEVPDGPADSMKFHLTQFHMGPKLTVKGLSRTLGGRAKGAGRIMRWGEEGEENE